MQKTQNADIQRVINLVELYRTKAGKESDRAKAAVMEYKDWFEYGIDQTRPNDDAQWEWVNVLSVNEQLLGHFYSVVAGENAEKDILQQLLPDLYDTNIFTQEEECFLVGHFREMVNYIIQTPSLIIDDYTSRWSDQKDDFLIPMEVLEIIKNRVDIPDTSVIYNLYAGLGQLATLYPSKAVYCSNEEDFCNKFVRVLGSKHDAMFYQRIFAWMRFCVWARLSMYANNVRSLYIGNRKKTFDYDVLIAYVPYSTKTLGGEEMLKRTHKAYKELKERGKMVLLCPSSLLWKDSSSESLFRELLVKDCSIEEIIQLPSSVMKSYEKDFCIIIAEKGRERTCATFIDATKAFKQKRIYSEEDAHRNDYNVLDVEAWNTLLQNGGTELETGLQKVIQLDSAELNPKILLPEICVLERPSKKEHPVPLSSLCTLESTLVGNIKFDLPEDTPWIDESNLTLLFSGPLDISTIQKANCPNNPKDWRWGDKPLSKFMMAVENSGITPREMRISEYRDSWFLDGSKDAVLYKYVPNQGIRVALIRKTGNPIAIDSGIAVFVPNEEVDAMSLVAILQMPIVYRQIQAYRLFGLERHYGDILVPTNKRVIGDEIKRLKLEEESYEAQKEKFDCMKTEYINEVRMRKHDMGQYVFELINIEDLMRYYMENKDKEKDFCQRIEELLDNFKASIGELSTLLDNLSKEEEFGEPERFDLHEFLSHLEGRHKTEGYVIKYECDMESIIDYNLQKKDEIDDYLLEQEEVDARAQQEIDDYLLEQQEEDARAQQEIDDYLLEQQEEDARVQQEIEDSLLEDEAYVFDETQTSDDESYVADETSNVDDSAYVFEENQAHDDNSYVVGDTLSNDDAYVFEESQTHDDEPYFVDEKQIVDDEPYVIDGFWGKYLSTIPSLYVAPNDIQRLVNNILDNARKHGFTDHKRGDYEVDVKLSINTETKMFQIDFRNNGNPLPDGMDKMRYGIKGEKAGSTGGTGIGGSYVKKCVEHYGGNYDIFMEDGWTVIRICLPIK